MRSPVNWAVLGMLIERPSYGYELHQRIVRRFPSEVLAPLPSHVYAALNLLERADLIEELPDEDADTGRRRRQPKVHYRVTPAGARAFRNWLATQLRADPGQLELVQRLALAAGMGRPGLLEELVDVYEHACTQAAQALPMPGGDGGRARSPEALVRRLTVAAQRTALEGQMEWLRYARKEIESYVRGEETTG